MPLFSDPALDKSFTESGYCVAPLLDAASVRDLLAAFEELEPDPSTGFHATMHGTQPERRRAIHETIRARVEGPVRQFLPGFRVCVANYVVKRPEDNTSEVGLHQDWTFVEEPRHLSLNVWCPLVDVDERNGCLWVAPRSQHFAAIPRAHSDPHPFQNVIDWMWQSLLLPVPMKAGTGIFYHSGLLHGSRSNASPRRRVATGSVLIPEGTPLVHYYRVDERTVEAFAVTEEFFWSHVPGTRPAGVPSLGTVPSEPRQLTQAEIEQTCAPSRETEASKA